MTSGVTAIPSLPLGPVVFITGYEVRPNGAHRIYVGPRYKGRYILLPPELAAEVNARRGSGHAFFKPEELADLPIFTAEAAA
jgi:hypothetical protein